MIKKLIIAPLLAASIIGIMPIGASAEWKKDSQQNYSWVENGQNAKGWKFIDSDWYNFSNDGVMQKGWLRDNGSWYYLWSNGSMAYNTWLSNGDFWYYLDSTGKMVSDSIVVRNREYDFQPAFIISNDPKAIDTTSVTSTTQASVSVTSTTQASVSVTTLNK